MPHRNGSRLFHLGISIELTITGAGLIIKTGLADQNLKKRKPVNGCDHKSQQDRRKQPCEEKRAIVFTIQPPCDTAKNRQHNKRQNHRCLPAADFIFPLRFFHAITALGLL